MDAKIYKASGVSSSQVPIAAAKINQDPDLISPNPPKGWYKFNASTTADSSGNSNTASASNMGSVVYDEFSVDVYDNSTTTDGTFTITQGKVECKALTSLNFDGTNDRAGLGNGLTVFDGATQGAFSAWVKRDTTGASHTIISHYDSTDSNRQFIFLVNGSDKAEINVQNDKSSFNSDHVASGTTTISANEWYHIVGTFSTTNGQKIYVNGVHEATAATTIEDALDTVASQANIATFEQGGSYTNYLDGNIRDLRLYTQELSADQVASLYSNTLPITPEHNWKFDDSIVGTEITTVADTGTGTAVDASMAGFYRYTGLASDSSSNWINGTLDLDGSLTVSANGTLSAPRGNMTLAGVTSNVTMDNYGVFTHNSGTVTIDHSADVTQMINKNGTVEPVFFNLTHNRPANSYHMFLKNNVTVENTFTNTAGFMNVAANKTLTLGTDTSQATYTTGWSGGGIRPAGTSTGNPAHVHGKNVLFPAIMASGSGDPIDWNNEAPDTEINIKFIDYQRDTSTGGSGTKVTLDGDCEFDAFTVSSGDTLDLNGQRAKLSGTLTGAGTVACGTNALIETAGLINFDNSGTWSGNCNIISTASANHYFKPASFAAHNVSNLFLNDGANPQRWGNNFVQNIIVGAGTQSFGDPPPTTGPIENITIATGATVNGADRTLTFDGDFTTSGGLLGASCLDLEKDNKEYVRIPQDASTNTHLVSPHTSGAMTVESWVKIESDAEMEVWHKATDYVLAVDPSGGATKLAWADGSNYDFSNWQHTLESGQLNVGKWHHIACVRDVVGSNGRISYYIDGKLVGQVTNTISGATWTDTDNVDLFIGRYSDSDSHAGSSYFDGNIENLRIWNVARTDAQIRESMFTAEYADGTSGLVEQFLFNEGNSHVVAGTNPTSAGTYANGAGEQYTSSEQANYTGIWAGAGTFTYGTSTLNMTGDGTMNIPAGFDVYNLTGGASSKTTTIALPSNGSDLDVYGTLTVDGGTLTDTNNADVIIRGTAPPVVNGKTTF